MVLVVAIMGAYYWLLFFPPRLVGSNDPDRYYHLGLTRLMMEHGLLRTLPQAEDLGWGRDFPEKEFLFHALTWFADWLGGLGAVMLLVPILGTAIILVLYRTLSRVCRPWQAVLFSTLVPLACSVFIYRLTMLRPHLLAILFFMLLVHAVLRRRDWLLAIACAGFSLSYHAFYVPMLALALAYLFKWRVEGAGFRPLAWGLGGLVAGTVLNPYFPDNVVMGLTHLGIAMGSNAPPGVQYGSEIQHLAAGQLVAGLGFNFFLLAVVAAQRWFRQESDARGADLRFLFALTLVFTLLSLKNIRASEYAIPNLVLLAGYFVQRADRRWWTIALVGPLLILQGTTAFQYYSAMWTQPQGERAGQFLSAISALPPTPGRKVYTCQWDAGAYLLFARPDLRFVDLLDPTFLWQASPEKYLLRQQLNRGGSAQPWADLRRAFHADYVLCGSGGLNAQMLSDPGHFRELGHDKTMGPVRVFELAPD
jgi:hypothetical protein